MSTILGFIKTFEITTNYGTITVKLSNDTNEIISCESTINYDTMAGYDDDKFAAICQCIIKDVQRGCDIESKYYAMGLNVILREQMDSKYAARQQRLVNSQWES